VLQLGDSGGYESTGYVSVTHWGTAAGRGLESVVIGFVIASSGAGGNAHFGSITLTSIGANFFSYSSSCYTSGQSYNDHSAGAKVLSATLDRIRLTNGGTANFGAGGTVMAQIIHAVT
jgi:hypothetical protein